MILVDFSQVMIMSISAAFNTFKNDLSEDMIRHIFLNIIKEYRKKFKSEFGNEIVLACDGRGYWRKDYFPYYKFKRAAGRAQSPLDWEFIFKCMDNLKSDIREYFPYRLVEVPGCEGDDVIAVLTDHFVKTRVLPGHECSLESRPLSEPIVIISADKDFLQLQLHGNVKQYSPLQKKFVSEDDIKLSRYMKILKGDVGDGVMNVFSDDDVLVNNVRQVVCSKKRLEPLLNSLMEHDKIPDDTELKIKRNFERNKTLIDLYDLQIPEELRLKIIDEYNSTNVAPRSKILEYFQKHQLRNLAEQINQF